MKNRRLAAAANWPAVNEIQEKSKYFSMSLMSFLMCANGEAFDGLSVRKVHAYDEIASCGEMISLTAERSLSMEWLLESVFCDQKDERSPSGLFLNFKFFNTQSSKKKNLMAHNLWPQVKGEEIVFASAVNEIQKLWSTNMLELQFRLQTLHL